MLAETDVADPSGEHRQLSPVRAWQVALRDSGLPDTRRLVALVLSTWMSPDGDSCFPSLPAIAKGTGLGLATVKRALADLEDAGWIHRERGGGRGHSNRYTARKPAHPEPLSAGETGSAVHPFAGETGSPDRLNRLTESRKPAHREPRSFQEVSKEGSAASEPEDSPPPWVVAGVPWEEWARDANEAQSAGQP
ncbi:MAG: helix-turn-helix domain-containing protein [Actinomycetota bacterium]